jgi:serine-type D-Ala-D-Ala carboxypeptidase/endopeptidase
LEWTGYDDATRHNCRPRYSPASGRAGAPLRWFASGGRQITLEQLSSQSSGLPRLPANLRPADALNPYADYTVAQMYEVLAGYVLPRDPGAQFEYSNLGVGLLGHALALRAQTSYEELLRERVLEPLDMKDTGITLSPTARTRVAAPHDAGGDTVPLWDLPTLAGAGALRSTTHDMLKLAEAALRGSGPVPDAIREAMRSRAPAGGPTVSIGLGWIRLATGGDIIVWHNGGTGGSRSFLAVVPEAGTAVVLLTNSGGTGSDDLALHLLNPALPLAPSPRQAVDVPAAILATYGYLRADAAIPHRGDLRRRRVARHADPPGHRAPLAGIGDVIPDPRGRRPSRIRRRRERRGQGSGAAPERPADARTADRAMNSGTASLP